MSDEVPKPAPNRRWFRFSLAALFVVMALFAGTTSWFAADWRSNAWRKAAFARWQSSRSHFQEDIKRCLADARYVRFELYVDNALERLAFKRAVDVRDRAALTQLSKSFEVLTEPERMVADTNDMVVMEVVGLHAVRVAIVGRSITVRDDNDVFTVDVSPAFATQVGRHVGFNLLH